MSIDGRAIRKLIFDSVAFTLTLSLLYYFAVIFPSPGYDSEFFVQNFPFFAILVGCFALVSLGLSFILYRFDIHTLGDALFAKPARKLLLSSRPLVKSFWFWHTLSLFALAFVASLIVTEVSFQELFDREGIGGAVRLWKGMASPNFHILPKAIVEALETVFIAFLSTTLAIPAAFVLAFFGAKNLMYRPLGSLVYSLLRLWLNVTRSIEPLIWALIFTVWVGVGPFAGMLALMIHSIASLTKYYSEIIESVDEGPLDAIRSTGASEVQVVWYAVVPQVVLPYIAMTVYRWDTNVRMATVIGLVGGGGIGTMLIQYQGQAMWPEVGCIILVIAIIVWIMDTASAYVREALK
jgi:phosphonate transport system permease protein